MQRGDPHSGGPLEAETLRVRVLPPAWRWALVGSAVATILLCVNQQFALRFLVGFTPLNTEYYYALVLVALPFVFPIFPGGPRAPLDRVPWYDALLFALTAAVAVYLLVHIRKAAELGWEFSGAPRDVVWAGFLMWAALMEGLRRTGGWGLLLGKHVGQRQQRKHDRLFALSADRPSLLFGERGTQGYIERHSGQGIHSKHNILYSSYNRHPYIVTSCG